jgi:hypothetical protein
MRKAFFISTLAAVAAAAALSTAAVGAAAKPVDGIFVGRVAGSNAFLAIAVGHGKARAYLCDSHRLGVWLPLGKIRSTYVELASSRVRLTGSIGRQEVQGTVTFADGSRHAFHAMLAPRSGAPGLYRAVKTVHGTRYVAGWILLRGGAQRGVVLNEKAVNATFGVRQAPVLNPESATVEVTEGGVATVVKLVDAIPLIPTTIQ